MGIAGFEVSRPRVEMMAKKVKYIECKWCGKSIDARIGYECWICWALRTRIESNLALARRMCEALEKKSLIMN